MLKDFPNCKNCGKKITFLGYFRRLPGDKLTFFCGENCHDIWMATKFKEEITKNVNSD